MSLSVILMIPVALSLVGLARFAMWLFPEQVGNKNHYDGNFGDTDQTLKSWDELTTAEKDDLWDI